MTKNLLLGIAAVCGSTFQAVACTGISLTSRDGSYVQALTISSLSSSSFIIYLLLKTRYCIKTTKYGLF